jgi:hypothetical protein
MQTYDIQVIFQNLARDFVVCSKDVGTASNSVKDFCLWLSNDPLPSIRFLNISQSQFPIFGGKQGGIILKKYDDEEILEVEDWQIEEQDLDWKAIEKWISDDTMFFHKETVELTSPDGTVSSFEVLKYNAEFMDSFIDSLGL